MTQLRSRSRYLSGGNSARPAPSGWSSAWRGESPGRVAGSLTLLVVILPCHVRNENGHLSDYSPDAGGHAACIGAPRVRVTASAAVAPNAMTAAARQPWRAAALI